MATGWRTTSAWVSVCECVGVSVCVWGVCVLIPSLIPGIPDHNIISSNNYNAMQFVG